MGGRVYLLSKWQLNLFTRISHFLSHHTLHEHFGVQFQYLGPFLNFFVCCFILLLPCSPTILFVVLLISTSVVSLVHLSIPWGVVSCPSPSSFSGTISHPAGFLYARLRHRRLHTAGGVDRAGGNCPSKLDLGDAPYMSCIMEIAWHGCSTDSP